VDKAWACISGSIVLKHSICLSNFRSTELFELFSGGPDESNGTAGDMAFILFNPCFKLMQFMRRWIKEVNKKISGD
jgi:hypothetical protein